MAAENSTCIIKANPDVSGVGIRASLYALCLSGRILAFIVGLIATKKNAEDYTRSITAALSIQGLALLCTAIVQTTKGELTLFHAIVVLHLLALLGINLAPRGRYRGNDLGRAVVGMVVVVLAVLAFITFNIYVWINAPRFGPQSECNGTIVYVIFGVSVAATGQVFRYIILATFATIPAMFLIVLLVGIPCWVAFFCSERGGISGASQPRSRPRCGRGGGGCLGGCLSISCPTSRRRGGDDGDDGVASDRSSMSYESEAHQRITELLQAVAYTVFSIYCIVSLEQMISRNNVAEEEREWTFGQIIAIFLLLGTIYELLTVLVSSASSGKASDPGQDQGQGMQLQTLNTTQP